MKIFDSKRKQIFCIPYLLGKMLVQGSFELNTVQRYADSFKEVLKQTMLNQEVIFRKQVYELHRLYSMQKLLTGDLDSAEFDGFNSWKASLHSTAIALPNSMNNKLLDKERTYFDTDKVSTQFLSKDLLKEHQGILSNILHRPLDIQLPADQYISHVNMGLHKKENVSSHPKEPIDVKNYLLGDLSCPEELKLSLSIGEDTSNKSCSNRSWYNKRMLSCHDVIDLEDSTGRISNNDAEPSSSTSIVAPSNCCKDNPKLQVSAPFNPIVSKSGEENAAGIPWSCSVVDGRESCQKQIVFNQGVDDQFKDLFSKKQQLASYEACELDLNRVQFDDSPCYSKDPTALTSSSSGVFQERIGKFLEGTCNESSCWRKPDDVLSHTTSDMLQEGGARNVSLMDKGTEDDGKGICAGNAKLERNSQNEVVIIDVECVSGPFLDLCDDLGSHGSNSKDLPMDLQNGLLCDGSRTDAAVKYLSSEKSAGQDVSTCPSHRQISIQGGYCPEFPPSNVDNTTGNNSHSIKTLVPGGEFGDSSLYAFDELPKTQFGSQVSETPSSVQDARSPDSSKLKHQCCSKSREQPAEVDPAIQEAAESLVSMALESSACYQDCYSKAGSYEMEIDEEQQPQCSSDSFELMTLDLTESSVVDYAVSSKTFEVNDTHKDFGFKLRRGRRLKDFQKEILPGLASLSRHEICEDINILDAVMRSREYRKMRSKMDNGEDWCLPARSRRRSRANYVRRRSYG